MPRKEKPIDVRLPRDFPLEGIGLSKALKFVIDSDGKSLYRICTETGLGEGHLSRIYTGEQNTTPTTLDRVAENVGLRVKVVV